MIGTSIGPYRIVEKLGSGGMGEVYLAHDTRLDRRVALKSLSEAWGRTPDARQRLIAEARAAAKLNHPHVAAVYDVIDAGDRACIVMEFVEGETLEARIRQGRLPPERAIDIGVQLADALTAAHLRGVLHRDLKPANIHLTPDGGVKVLDFGIADVQEAGSPATSPEEVVTRASEWLGTPAYMAPEQLLGHRGDARSDVYSLGVVLFEMLTGRRPFDSTDPAGFALAVLTEQPSPPHQLEPSTPPELGGLIMRTLAREPGDRFQTAEALRNELAAVARTIRQQPTRPLGRPGRHRSENPGLRGTSRALWLGAPAVIALVVFLVTSILVLRERPAPLVPEPVVAVLSLANESGDPVNDFLGAGIADVLVANLSAIPDISVVPRSTTREFVDLRGDIRRLGQELGATYIVDGGVQRLDDRVRVTANLLRTDSGHVVWSQTYEGTIDDIFALQRELAGGLTEALELRLSPADRQRLEQVPTSNREAFAEAAQARVFLERPDVPGSLDRAVRLFESAVDRDPGFALAHAGLGEAYWAKFQETRDPVWTTRATQAILEALRLNPEQPQVRFSLALVYQGTGRQDAALEEIRRVLDLQPGSDDAHRMLGDILASQADIEGAVAAFERAIELRPIYWRNYSRLGVLHYRNGRYEDAIAAFERVTELQPDSFSGYQALGTVYQAAGDQERALANYERANQITPMPSTYTNIGTLHYEAGRFAEATQAYERAIELSPRNPLYYRNLGDAHLRLGQQTKADGVYQRAVELLTDLLSVNPRDAFNLSLLAVCEAKLGHHADARRHMAEALAVRPDDGEVLYRDAVVHALAGDAHAALSALERALAHGFSPSLVASDSDLAAIRELPEYGQLDALTRGRSHSR